MTTTIHAASDVVEPLAPAPSFGVATDRATFKVEVTTEALLFGAASPARRSPRNFWTSPAITPASPHAVTTVTLPAAVWRAFRGSFYVYYRAVGQNNPKDADPSLDPLAGPPPFILVGANLTRGRTLKANLSGTLPRLSAIGNQLTSGGGPVVLRGVNRSGMEYTAKTGLDPVMHAATRTWRTTAGITDSEVSDIAGTWLAKIVRIPINQERVLSPRFKDYMADLDDIITLVSKHGAYSLLDLQWFSESRSDANGNVPPLPEEDSVRMWMVLAARYRLQRSVLYDIFNEPHVPAPGSPFYPYARPTPGSTGEHGFFLSLWHEWVRRISNAIWRVNGKALIFVGGFDWGSDLASYPVKLPSGVALPNCVYSAHWYLIMNRPYTVPPATVPDHPGWLTSFRNRIGDPSGLRMSYPVFIGEWGGIDPGQVKDKTLLPALETLALDWGQTLADFLRPLHASSAGVWQGLLGWTAWSWADDPLLVYRDPPYRTFRIDPLTGDHVPTDFGDLVKRELSH